MKKAEHFSLFKINLSVIQCVYLNKLFLQTLDKYAIHYESNHKGNKSCVQSISKQIITNYRFKQYVILPSQK